MPPQVNTPVVAKVVDTPAPSVIEPVEASNVEVSKVPELDESNVEPVATDSADDVIPHKPVRAVKTIPFSETSAGSLFSKVVELDHSWMYETSDDDSSGDIESVNSNVWDESHDQILDESSLEEFERARQAEAYEEYIEEFERGRQAKAVTSAATEKEVTSTATEVIQPTKAQLRRWAYLILDGNYLERREEIAEAENLVLDQQQIDQLKVKTSVKSKATTKTKEITGEDEIKKIILKKIVDDMMLLDKDLIRQCNKVDLYDLSSLRNVTIDVSKLALLIRQTLVRTDNNGLPMWYGKNNTKLRFGEEEVDAIEFSPVGKVFQTYKMAISYKYSAKFKPAFAHLKMSDILDAVTHLVNHKSADVHPYGPFDAHQNDPRVFNLFSGFPHVYNPEHVINQERVDVWLDHIKHVLSDGNDDVYSFFVNSLVCPSMERITARFNSIRQSKLSIVLDEAFDSNNRSMNNQMKSYITDDRTQIERKGLETIEVNDYANYVILTNNDFGSIIEANDRRYMCLVASECRVGDEKYFDHYFDTLANIDAGRDIFHYLARVDLTGFKPQSFPLTKYKKELKAKQTNNVVKWLLNMHETLSDEADDEIKIASTSDWYNKYCRWAETSEESRSCLSMYLVDY
ncbi:unnamed protein product [Phytophthora lilii]|uniref:Unnamed protein product n=1 Tax=Phytophthora lilii TaxID=2077276 RepID=A0A9W6XCJ3_9STRA|nr:unnamed protein product [Phytophthora lilii]